MSDIHTTVTEGIQFWQIATAGMAFALLFPVASFLINRRLCDGTLKWDAPGIAQLAALVFLLAILCETTVNPSMSGYSMTSFGIIDSGLFTMAISLRCPCWSGPVMASTSIF